MIHNVLVAACGALEVSTDEFEPEGKAVVDDWRYEDLVAWIARQAEPKLSSAQRAEAKRCLALLAKAKTKKLSKEEASSLRCDEAATGLSDGEIVVTGLKMYAVKGARRAAIAAARLLGLPFLDALAKELWRLDAISLVAKQRLRPPEAPPIRESLWRGSTGARITHHLVQLEGDRCGLIAKTRGKWTWLEGSRDDTLASVPDGQLRAAVSAVLGSDEPKKKPTPSDAPVILELDDKLAAVAMSSDGTAWALTRKGRLGSLAKGARDFSWSPVGAKNVTGLAASRAGALLWGTHGLSTFANGRLTPFTKGKVDGAQVDDETIAWWSGAKISIGKKSLRAPAGASVSVRAKRVFAVGTKETLVFDALTGKELARWPMGGAGHAASLDGSRLAIWGKGAKARVVTLLDLASGKSVASDKLDSGDPDLGVFTDDGRLLVRYHSGLRVAFIGPDGRITSRVEGRKLGTSGSTVRVVFPLERGAVLGFANYPRGEAVLVDAQSQALGRWHLGTLFVGGRTRSAEGGGRVILTHDFSVQRVLVF